MKLNPGSIGIKSLQQEVAKLRTLEHLQLSADLLSAVPTKVVARYRNRAAAETLHELRRHPDTTWYTMLAAFCWQWRQELLDTLIDLLLLIIHKIGARAEKRVDKQLLEDFKRVDGKTRLLYRVAEASLAKPEGTVREVIFKAVGEQRLKDLVADVANAIFRVRRPDIWGEATATCASDSKQFGSWDHNLLTEWHLRYGGKGIMIYWHVEKHATCIYSQVKTVSSSEVAAMIQGVMRHYTDMQIQKHFVDSHGQSEIAFGFCKLLGFQLMPRLKNIYEQKLYLVDKTDEEHYPHLRLILERAINWELIRQQYDQMVKYATALRLGTAETEAILRRFNRTGLKHPTYRAFLELGKAVKTIFLCRYLQSEELRREIHEGLNVIENWNGATAFIFYGHEGDFQTNRLDEQELAALSLHLLQICLVYINTLLLQRVLADPKQMQMMQAADWRGLTPLFYQHINPYGTFRLDMNERMAIEEEASA